MEHEFKMNISTGVASDGTVDEAKPSAFSSSNIKGAHYDPEAMMMFVTFKSGRSYTYFAVPADVWQKFNEAESKGSFFATYIKDSFLCKKTEDKVVGVDMAHPGGDRTVVGQPSPDPTVVADTSMLDFLAFVIYVETNAHVSSKEWLLLDKKTRFKFLVQANDKYMNWVRAERDAELRRASNE